MPSIVSPVKQNVPDRWRPLRPTADASDACTNARRLPCDNGKLGGSGAVRMNRSSESMLENRSYAGYRCADGGWKPNVLYIYPSKVTTNVSRTFVSLYIVGFGCGCRFRWWQICIMFGRCVSIEILYLLFVYENL